MARRQLKLYGKKVTTDNILLEINNLLYAKGYRPIPLKPVEIAKALDLSRTKPTYIRNFMNVK